MWIHKWGQVTTPDAFEGEDTITYTAADDSGSTAVGTVIVVIAGQNLRPTIVEMPDGSHCRVRRW